MSREQVRIKSLIIKITSGKWGNEANGKEFDIKVIRIADFDRNNNKLKNQDLLFRSIENLTKEDVINTSKDLLIEKSGGGERTPVGQVVKVSVKDDVTYTNFISKLTVDTTLVNLDYLNLVFSSLYHTGTVKKHIKQTTGIQNLDINSYFNEKISLPTIERQYMIVKLLEEKLNNISKITTETKQSIEELKKYKQSLITEVVTKGLDKNVEMKDSGIEWIGEIPKDWEVVKLKKIISNKLQYGANESGIPYNPESPRYIRITDIMDSKTLKDENKISLEVEKSRNYLLEEGDFLFARSGASVGKFYLVDQKNTGSAFAGYLIRAKFNVEKVLPKYFEYYAHSWIYDEWKQSISIQSTIENIGAEKYNNLFVILPDIVTQKLLIKYLDKHIEVIDNLITNKIKIINEYESYKKSLIYEYVTGKKEVGEEVE